MHKGKKLLAIILALVISISLMPIANVDAAKKVKLNKKKVTIYVGKAVTLKLKNNKKKIKWSSSNKKVATVNKKGKVKAKKKGKTIITAKVGKKKYKCRVTVKNAKKMSTTKPVEQQTTKMVESLTTYKVEEPVTKVELPTTQEVESTRVQQTTSEQEEQSTNVIEEENTTSAQIEETTTSDIWELEWSDEFDGSELDTSIWQYETGKGIDGWGNHELQDYTDGQNVEIKDGNLIIIPRITVQDGQVTSATSTRINTKLTKEIQYGKIEIRAKVAKGTGLWSAGWMLGTNGQTWPTCGEIDILEVLRGGVHQAIQCTYFNNQAWAKGGNKSYTTGLTKEQATEEYHTYGIIWTETYIIFLVDDIVIATYNPHMYPYELSETWPFDNPFYFIINCAIGGNAASEVTTDGWTLKSTDGEVQTWEDYYYIDYVRVYKWKSDL